MDKVRARALLIPFLMSLAAVVLFPLLYHCDNKYTREGVQPIGGLLVLSEADIERTPIHYLIREWEFYPGVLLQPADFEGRTPDLYRQYASIGQYGGLDLGRMSSPHHGSATYRLTLDLPYPAREYALELPEIYSSYRLYVDGDLVLQMGDPNPAVYREAIQNRVVSLSASGRVQLLLAVTDHSGVYSGLTHPPAIGTLDAVLRTRDIRFFLHTAGMLIALLGALLSLYLGLMTHQKRWILFFVCCLCHIGITCYPLLHTLFETAYQPWYAAEIACFYAMLLFAVMLQNALYGIRGKAGWLTLVPCLLGVVVALAYVAGASIWSTRVMRAFSIFSTWLKCYASLYLIGVSGYAFLRRKRYSSLLLGASLFLSLSLLFDRALPLYEPILGGWFSEVGSAALVLALASALWSDLTDAYRFRLTFAIEFRQMEQQLSMQREHYRQLADQVETARSATHDLRHHMRTLRAFADQGDLQRIRDYLQNYEPRLEAQEIASYSDYPVADAVLRYYASAAHKANATFDVMLALPQDLSFPDDELCILLGNLLENAVEACARQTAGRRFIYLRGEASNGRLGLVLDNSFDGRVDEKNGRYYSSKRDGFGIGVRSVQTIVEKHGGLCSFEVAENVFKVSLLIPLGPPPPSIS